MQVITKVLEHFRITTQAFSFSKQFALSVITKVLNKIRKPKPDHFEQSPNILILGCRRMLNYKTDPKPIFAMILNVTVIGFCLFVNHFKIKTQAISMSTGNAYDGTTSDLLAVFDA